jgi:hypothetical protein
MTHAIMSATDGLMILIRHSLSGISGERLKKKKFKKKV